MAETIETMSFLAYWLSKLPADAVVSDNSLLIQQGDTIRRIDLASFEAALFSELGFGPSVTVAIETTLDAGHGRVYVNAPEGVTVYIHLPAYGSVSPYKGYRLKNVGLGLVVYDALDAKTIDGEVNKELYPGDNCAIAKDGANWQTE